MGHDGVRAGGSGLVLTMMLMSVFGPYVYGSVRTEQLVVYVAALVALALTLPLMRLERCMVQITLLWTVLAGVSVLGALVPPQNLSGWPRGSVLAGADALLLPVAVVSVVLAALALGANPTALLRRACVVIVLLLLVNTAASAGTALLGLEWSRWWSEGSESTGLRAAAQGRVSGLINQPGEAGVLYGVALLCAIYLWASRAVILSVVGTVLIVGGVLTISKVFLLVALPIIVWQLVRLRRGRFDRYVAFAGTGAILLAAAASGWLPPLPGRDQLLSIAPSALSSPISGLTGNRYGAESTLLPVLESVFDGPVFFGFGAAGLRVPYDSAWVEAAVFAGLIGVACFAGVLVALAFAWVRSPNSAERTLFGGILLLVTGASLGLPVLTANRVSTVLWILIVLLVAILAHHEPNQRPISVGRQHSLSHDPPLGGSVSVTRKARMPLPLKSRGQVKSTLYAPI